MRQLLLCFFILISTIAFSQFTTPSIDGTLSSSTEYGNHTNGQNRQGEWYFTWDETNLYVCITNTTRTDAAILYIDTDPMAPVNGGTNANGSLVGQSYDNTNFSNLPFRANYVFFIKPFYREFRAADGSGGWGTETTSFGSYADNGSTLREVVIPWTVLGGRPSSMNFFGYITTSAGSVYNQVPTNNPSGSIGTTATNNYYYTVSNTADGTATPPFSRTSFTTNASITLSTAQSLWDFTVNGSSITTTLTAMQSVSGAVAVANGNTLAAGGNLTLVSTAAGTARLAYISTFPAAMGSITGNVTCQLYIPGGNRRFRFLSHPFSSDRNINMLSGVDYTGAGGVNNGFSVTTPTNNPSVFTFNTSNANGNATNDAGWTAITSANAGTPWLQGRGIRLLVRGTPGQGLNGNNYTPSATTISMTGVLNTGGVFVEAFAGGTGATQNFNLFGNPLAAPVNLGVVRSSNGNVITKDIYVRNPSTGGYVTIDLDVTPNYAIPAYAAFFGVRTGSNTALIFNPISHIVGASSGTTVFRGIPNSQKYFELQTIWNGEVYDNMYVKFGDNYRTNFDVNEDGGKPANDIINSYTLSSDSIRLANNCVPFKVGSTIQLGVTQASGKRNLQFKVNNYQLAAEQRVILVDKLLNTRTILEKDVVYNFEIDNSQPATVGNNRFLLEMQDDKVQVTNTNLPLVQNFSAKIVGTNIINTGHVQVQITNPKKAVTSVRLVSLSGQVVTTQQAGEEAIQTVSVATSGLPTGKYLLQVFCGEEKQVLPMVKQ